MADQQVKITISAIDNATKALNDVKNSLKGVSKETDNTQQSFFTLKNAVLGFATVGLVSLGRQIIDVTISVIYCNCRCKCSSLLNK